jgi:HAD superfamily phosphoserine phosphatase-like hydrolase
VSWYDLGVTVAADLEGTLTTGETWRAVGRHLASEGAPSSYRWFLTRRIPELLAARAGLIDRRAFQNRWMRDLLTFFRGASPDEFLRVAVGVVERDLWPLRRREVVAALVDHHAAGERVVLASGTYQPLLEAFAARLAAEAGGPVEALGTPVEVVTGRLTGRLAGPVNVGAVKARRLGELLGSERLTTAYGDTASDLPFLRLSDRPVAVHPDARLRSVARRCGWFVLDA